MAGGVTFDPAEFEAFKQAAGGPAPAGAGGFDPSEFAAFKAEQTRTDTGRETGAMNAAARGLVDGIPVAGPYILGGIDRADAAARAYMGGTDYGSEVAKAQAYGADVKAAHPYANTAGEVAGGIVGTAPLIAAAPAAFGAGTGGLIGRSLISAASGSALGGADAAVRNDGDLIAARNGAIAGGALGAAAPAAGAALGAGMRNFYEMIGSRLGPSSGFSPAATRVLAEDAANSGGVAPIRSRMGELGSEAMLLDASPSFQGQAQGLAVRPETREAVTAPIITRAGGMTDRLASDINGAFGPAISPQAATDTFAAMRQVPNQAIGAAVDGAQSPVSARPVLGMIDDRLQTARGAEETVLRRARDMLAHTDPETGWTTIADDPRILHNVKQEMDRVINYGDPGLGVTPGALARKDGAAQAVRGHLNDLLRDQVPGYGAANDVSAALARRMEAVDQGSQLLRSGQGATPPQDLARQLAGMPQGERDAMAIGTRGAIDQAVGTRRNDLVAMQNLLQGEGGWNTANLAQLHGQAPVDRVVGAVNREAAFDQANRRIVEGSQTAQRGQAADRVAPRTTLGNDIGGTVAGAIGGPQGWALAQAGRVARAGINAAGQAADVARNRQLADAVTLTQGDRLNALLSALEARGAMQQRAAAFGNLAARGGQAAMLSQADRVRPYLPAALPAFSR
ncbi:hypothetical protein [Methylobacterium pseudosasicola]|uniref:Uncharacterized protein n=1 Tax=Methylobacterium pseudosasicola TaxID=582667 RepID=A0A1I4SEC4_9HYPH|nr:hypothetical protein [Methylobacterium pseudosasicola]SFM62633.1 hypothetical protein SAMN05192568_104170 [Methylobacterium pseudosasicola]